MYVHGCGMSFDSQCSLSPSVQDTARPLRIASFGAAGVGLEELRGVLYVACVYGVEREFLENIH